MTRNAAVIIPMINAVASPTVTPLIALITIAMNGCPYASSTAPIDIEVTPANVINLKNNYVAAPANASCVQARVPGPPRTGRPAAQFPVHQGPRPPNVRHGGARGSAGASPRRPGWVSGHRPRPVDQFVVVVVHAEGVAGEPYNTARLCTTSPCPCSWVSATPNCTVYSPGRGDRTPPKLT